MKSTTFFALLSTALLAYAAPEPALNTTGAPSIGPTQKLPHLKSRQLDDDIPGNFKDCASDEMHYPAQDEYVRALQKACIKMIPSSYYFVEYGYKRTTVDVAVFDWPTTVGMSFEFWQYKDELPGQTFSQQECMATFYSNSENEGINGCIAKKSNGGKDLLVKGFMYDRVRAGFETVAVRANILG